MTWRNSSWSGPFRWMLVVILLLFAGIMVMMWVDDSIIGTSLVFGYASILVVAVLIVSLHNWLTVGDNGVRIGYFPFYRRTIPYNEIREIRIVEIKPVGQFGGWGLKGLPRSRYGMLLGGYPPKAVRIETTEDKRYASTFAEDDLSRIVSALQARGCKLSAENDAPPTEGSPT